jgi:hypothetical protein
MDEPWLNPLAKTVTESLSDVALWHPGLLAMIHAYLPPFCQSAIYLLAHSRELESLICFALDNRPEVRGSIRSVSRMLRPIGRLSFPMDAPLSRVGIQKASRVSNGLSAVVMTGIYRWIVDLNPVPAGHVLPIVHLRCCHGGDDLPVNALTIVAASGDSTWLHFGIGKSKPPDFQWLKHACPTNEAPECSAESVALAHTPSCLLKGAIRPADASGTYSHDIMGTSMSERDHSIYSGRSGFELLSARRAFFNVMGLTGRKHLSRMHLSSSRLSRLPDPPTGISISDSNRLFTLPCEWNRKWETGWFDGSVGGFWGLERETQTWTRFQDDDDTEWAGVDDIPEPHLLGKPMSLWGVSPKSDSLVVQTCGPNLVSARIRNRERHSGVPIVMWLFTLELHEEVSATSDTSAASSESVLRGTPRKRGVWVPLSDPTTGIVFPPGFDPRPLVF